MPFLKKWGRLIGCLLLVAAILLVYVLRLAQWQLIEGEKYAEISDDSSNFYVKLDAARGEILDRNGNILAGNRTTYNVVMNALTMEEDRNPAILAALNILQEDNVKWIDTLPIVLNEAGEYEFAKGKESEIETLKSADMLNMQEYATAQECMNALISKYNCQQYSPEDARNIISVRYNMTKTQFSRSAPYVIAEDVPMETVEKINENFSKMPGVETRVSTVREYEDGTTAPHIVGTLGSINQEQYDYYEKNGMTYSSDNVSGYSYTEIVGQSGIESAFESTLRGTNGKETVITNSDGDIVSSEVTEKPVPGNSVYLTLDNELQRVANESLARNVEEASKKAKDCIAGAAVVLDVKTFGVLAAASYPTFDIEKYQSDDNYYNDLLEDESRPLFNRAFDGIFTPGSVFKPMVALAALNEGIIDTSSTVYCDGSYDYFQDGNPATCLGVHGDANVSTAIEKSCNVFFYDVGRRLTIDKMGVYADLFSLGSKTGIEISEASGIMSGKQEYEQNHGVSWVDGLTIQAAIGQCDSMFTPLQLATYCATIANDGVRLKTHLVDKIMDYDGQKVIEEYEPVVEETIDISPEIFDVVQNAMVDVCGEGGTAYNTFGGYGVAVAAKTGTAENPNHSDNTLFMAYAPYDDPQIAVAVVLEYGRSGTYSQAVAKDIMDKYFYGETEAEKAEREQKEESASASAQEEQETESVISDAESEESRTESGAAALPDTAEPPMKRGDDIPEP